MFGQKLQIIQVQRAFPSVNTTVLENLGVIWMSFETLCDFLKPLSIKIPFSG